MNKYDEKIKKYAKDSKSIVEVRRTKKMSLLETILDIAGDFVLTLADGLNIKGNYYLITKDKTIDLVLIKSKSLDLQIWNVTSEVNSSKDGKKFEFDGNIYKVTRKIK